MSYYDVAVDEFERIALEESKRQGFKKRISHCMVCGYVVKCTVRSVTGFTTWTFRLNFGGNGYLTDTYMISTDNNDSPIPRALAENILNRLREDFSDRIIQKSKMPVPTSKDISQKYFNNNEMDADGTTNNKNKISLVEIIVLVAILVVLISVVMPIFL